MNIVDYSIFFSDISMNARPSTIRELMKYSGNPDFISFGGGYPSLKSFLDDGIKEAISNMSSKELKESLQYSNSPGIPRFLELLQRMVEKESGKKPNLERLLVTNGSQEGIFLSSIAFINPGDPIAVEEPTYITGINAFDLFEPVYKTVDLDSDGMKVNDLERILDKQRKNKKIKFIYTVPTFHNPAGVTMSLERRKKLLELSKHHKIPIIEDSPYERLRFTGKHIPSLMELDNNNLVTALRTFSKTFCPGFRIGYCVAPEDVIKKYITIRQSIDLHSSTFNQYVMANVINNLGLDRYYGLLKKNAQLYKEQKDAMISALEKVYKEREYGKQGLPKIKLLSEPEGGLFLWGALPSEFNVKDMLECLIKKKVLVIPGEDFSALGHSKDCMRLSYSLVPIEKMEEGVKRLYEAIKEYANDKKLSLPLIPAS